MIIDSNGPCTLPKIFFSKNPDDAYNCMRNRSVSCDVSQYFRDQRGSTLNYFCVYYGQTLNLDNTFKMKPWRAMADEPLKFDIEDMPYAPDKWSKYDILAFDCFKL